MKNLATSPRNLALIQLRTWREALLRNTQRVVRKLSGRRPAQRLQTLLFHPAVGDLAQLGDLVNRAAWYLPDSEASVLIPCRPHILEAVAAGAPLSAPGSQQRYFDALPPQVRLVEETAGLKAAADGILLWDWRSWPSLGAELGKAYMVDPAFHSTTECGTWVHLNLQTLSQARRQELTRVSKENFDRFFSATAEMKKAYVFTTGPSIDTADQWAYEPDSLKIICNSMVKNTQLLDQVQPTLLVFADPVFHFSPCLYAARFRDHAVAAIERYGCYCIVPEAHFSLLIAHHPHLADKLIGMPIIGMEAWNFPTPGRFFTAITGNIMTMFMVPVASSVPRQVFILGADGRQKNENYFWKHSSQNQFDDLMQTVVDTHSSFFRDRVYTDYYDAHCEAVNDQITFGESQGVQYCSLTPSYIPALASRCVDSAPKVSSGSHVS